MKVKIVAILYLYYPDTWESIWKNLIHFPQDDVLFTVFICSSNPRRKVLIEKIRNQVKHVIILESPNKGKDIGAKLMGIDLALKVAGEAQYLLFLHDKKSPHTAFGDIWRRKLLRIIEKENVPDILQRLDNNPSIGIVCNAGSIMNEYNIETHQFKSTSNELLHNALRTYSMESDSHSFVAGTMFWARFKPYKDFFSSKASPLSIRQDLENGNVLDHDNGSITHVWERMLSWIVTFDKLKIEGI